MSFYEDKDGLLGPIIKSKILQVKYSLENIRLGVLP